MKYNTILTFLISILTCASCTRVPDKIANGCLFLENRLTFKYLKRKGFVGSFSFNPQRICIRLGSISAKASDTQEVITRISRLQKKIGTPPIKVEIYRKGVRQSTNPCSLRFIGLIKVLDLKTDGSILSRALSGVRH